MDAGTGTLEWWMWERATTLPARDRRRSNIALWLMLLKRQLFADSFTANRYFMHFKSDNRYRMTP
jgi:hypothetical protein